MDPRIQSLPRWSDSDRERYAHEKAVWGEIFRQCPVCAARFARASARHSSEGIHCPICDVLVEKSKPGKKKKSGKSGKSAIRTEKQIAALVIRDGTLCWLCNAFMPKNDRTRDHVIPRSKGGSNKLSNLRLAHGFCNSKRGNADVPDMILSNDQEGRDGRAA